MGLVRSKETGVPSGTKRFSLVSVNAMSAVECTKKADVAVHGLCVEKLCCFLLPALGQDNVTMVKLSK
jgi:hypothetical protein